MGSNDDVPIHEAQAAWTDDHARTEGAGTAIYKDRWEGKLTADDIKMVEAFEIYNGVRPAPYYRDHLSGNPALILPMVDQHKGHPGVHFARAADQGGAGEVGRGARAVDALDRGRRGAGQPGSDALHRAIAEFLR